MTKQHPTKIAVVRCASSLKPALEWAALRLSTRENRTLRYMIKTLRYSFFLLVVAALEEECTVDRFPKKQYLDFVHLSSCMLMKDTYPKCPNLDCIKKTIQDAGINVFEGTHH